MNILFVTNDLQDAGTIRHELTGLIPDLHLEISSDITEAIGLATAPARFSAVLVDSSFQEGDPLAFIRAVRAENAPVAIIGLAEPTDLVSVAKLMGAGADDYVLRRDGFVAGLPATLRRICGKYETNEDSRTLQRLLYMTRGGAETSRSAAAGANVTLRPVPGRRDSTGATCFLLRDVSETEPSGDPVPDAVKTSPDQDNLKSERDAFLKALKVSNANRIKLKEELSAARVQGEQERSLLEGRIRDAEEHLARESEELRAERQQWDRWRLALKQRLAAVEESRAALEQSVLQESERQEQLAAQYCAELERDRQSAADEIARLQGALETAEARLGSQIGQHRTETEQWASARAEFDRRRADLETRIADLEAARSGLELEYRENLAQAQKARLELEQSAAAVVHDLRVAIEEHEVDGTRWKSERNELEQRTKLLEEEVGAARRKHDELLESGEQYRGKWETANAELQQLRGGVAEIRALAREASDLYRVFLDKLRGLDNASAGTGPVDA